MGKKQTKSGEMYYSPEAGDLAEIANDADKPKAPPLTARQRFQKHAERRVSEVLRALKRLGNIANRKAYEYTDEEAAQLLDAVQTAHRDMRGKFLEPLTADKSGGFRFSGWGQPNGATTAPTPQP